MLSEKKRHDLQVRMERLGIQDGDLLEKFIMGHGAGGQKVNKTSSAVYLKHIPTGIEVKCQQERSRELNRFFARRLLVEKLEKKLLDEKSQKEKEADKIRKQKARRSRRVRLKVAEEKLQHSEKKKLRKVSLE